jgi:predicted DNA-binding transcriptional regulator AlpA
MPNDEQMERVFLVRKDLGALGIYASNTTLLRWERLGHFPQRVRFAKTTVAWFRVEILKWIEERAIERASYVYAEY